jgi:hypothetical protein
VATEPRRGVQQFFRVGALWVAEQVSRTTDFDETPGPSEFPMVRDGMKEDVYPHW